MPDHVSPAGGKTDWDVVARTLNTRTGKNFTPVSIMNWFMNMKKKHKAWNELKNWTGIGWSNNNCPEVDVHSEKWQAFVKRYRSIANTFLKIPLENEAEWDNILISGYAKGDRSFTPASLGMKLKQKEVLSVEAKASCDSDNDHEIGTHNNDIQACIVPSETKKRKDLDNQPSRISSKRSTEEDINACLDQLKQSSLSQSSKPKNPFDEVLNILESMGIVEKYGEAFVVDILDSFHSTPGAIDLFTSLRSDGGRLHFLRKHCKLEDDAYKPDTSFTSLLEEGFYEN